MAPWLRADEDVHTQHTTSHLRVGGNNVSAAIAGALTFPHVDTAGEATVKCNQQVNSGRALAFYCWRGRRRLFSTLVALDGGGVK